MRSLKFLIFVLVIVSTISCDRNYFYENNVAIDNSVWNQSDTVRFSVDIQDTLQQYNILINVRNSGRYEFANLFIFINTIFPDKQEFKDTVECILATPEGRWLGSGIGNIIDNQIGYKRNIRFPKIGVYTFEFEQGMRREQLKEIMDVGLRIEKTK